jgi:hypothetical protein
MTLPTVLLAQQAPVGPARPKTLAITAGRACLCLIVFDVSLTCYLIIQPAKILQTATKPLL